MSNEFSCVKLPKLYVSTKELIDSELDPMVASVLLGEFETEGENPYYTGYDQSSGYCEERSKTFGKLSEYLIRQYEDVGRTCEPGRWPWPHSSQREVLEKAIRLLSKSDMNDPKVLLNMGKAHLYRSRIIRPKGFTIPAKKIEGLKKALHYCLESRHDQAKHYAALSAIELDICNEKPAEFDRILDDAGEQIDFETYSPDMISEFFKIQIRRMERNRETKYEGELLKTMFNEHKEIEGLELERFKVAILIPDEAIHKFAHPCFLKLYEQFDKSPFSHPIWENSVRFALRLYSLGNGMWRKFAISLWEAAEKKAIDTFSVHLRWYWSRQRNLYDLAFLAALEPDEYGNYESEKVALASKIADSAKSRPALTWQAIEKMAETHATLRPMLEENIQWNADVLNGAYIKEFRRPAYAAVEENNPEFPEKIATQDMIIQFYLVHLDVFPEKADAPVKKNDSEKNGYALVYDPIKSKWCHEPAYRFDFKSLWRKYISWQAVYFDLPASQRIKSAGLLKPLCLELGKQLSFLRGTPNRKNIVFAPHDFLHRVPLHGAMWDEDSCLLESSNCAYTPAVCLGGGQNNTKDGGGSYALKYFSPGDRLNEFYQKKVFESGFFDHTINSSSSVDLLEVIGKNPNLLSLICHGKSDYVNPFFSKLVLKDELSVLDLAMIKMALGKTGLFLNACETDLSGPTNAPIDEHLSLSSILLNKGAGFVLSAGFEIYPFGANIPNLIKEMKLKGAEAVFAIQRKLWEMYMNKDFEIKIRDEKLYHCFCYKLYKPYTKPDQEEKC